MGPIAPHFSVVPANGVSNNFGGNIDNFSGIVTAVNAQLSLIDASNNVSLSIAYIDGSLAPFATNASIGIKFVINDASIVALQTADKTFATNSSIGTAAFVKRSTITIADTSMYFTATDTSVWSWKVTKVV